MLAELLFLNGLLVKNSKEYQIWNLKKDLFSKPEIQKYGLSREKLKAVEEDFMFHLMVKDDEKNYHAWDFKTWMTRQFNDL